MGSCLVYPGANHTRITFGLYASDATVVLRFKGSHLCRRENALYIAILLHDIGHGPSRAYGKVLLKMYITKSPCCLHQLNTEFNGQLDLSIQVLKVIIVYLCCNSFSQLDMDRMDYLKRDSFIQV
jgi:HD superfamily phosphohydrolase